MEVFWLRIMAILYAVLSIILLFLSALAIRRRLQI